MNVSTITILNIGLTWSDDMSAKHVVEGSTAHTASLLLMCLTKDIVSVSTPEKLHGMMNIVKI